MYCRPIYSILFSSSYTRMQILQSYIKCKNHTSILPETLETSSIPYRPRWHRRSWKFWSNLQQNMTIWGSHSLTCVAQQEEKLFLEGMWIDISRMALLCFQVISLYCHVYIMMNSTQKQIYTFVGGCFVHARFLKCRPVISMKRCAYIDIYIDFIDM